MKKNRILSFLAIAPIISLPLLAANCVGQDNDYIKFQSDVAKIKYEQDFSLDYKEKLQSEAMKIREKAKANLLIDKDGNLISENKTPDPSSFSSKDFTAEYLWGRNLFSFSWKNPNYKNYKLFLVKVFDQNNGSVEFTYRVKFKSKNKEFESSDLFFTINNQFLNYSANHNHYVYDTKASHDIENMYKYNLKNDGSYK